MGPGNRALIDAAATSAAIDAATSISEDLFSYTYTDLAAHEATFGRLTTGAFSSRYGELFSAVGTQATAQQLTLTSTVVESAVQVLNDDSAGVLVFLDQEAGSAATGRKTASTAAFRATMHRVDGEWKFAGIDLYEDR